MKLLLDTHIWVWSQLERTKLKPRVVEALDSLGNELWLSPISVWELALLVEKARVVLDLPVDAWVGETLRRIPLQEAPLTHEIALESRRLSLPHQDPADRFLAATAKVLGLTLVTADRNLIEARGLSVLPNR